MRGRKKENQSVELEAAATFEGWDEMDETSKRRIRNRLSQRHFRERKSMYIKSLEKASKASSQSESSRNKALAKEIADLRATTLKMRAQILKLAFSLHSIGAEVGKILHVDGLEDSESPGPEPEDGQPMSGSSNLGDDGSSLGDFNNDHVSEGQTEFPDLQQTMEAAANSDKLDLANSRISANLPPEVEREQEYTSRCFDDGAGEVSSSRVPAAASAWDGQNVDALFSEPSGSQAFNTTYFSPHSATKAASPFGDVAAPGYDHPAIETSNICAPVQVHKNAYQGVLHQPEHQGAGSVFHQVPTQTNITLPTGHFPPFSSTAFGQDESSSTFARHMETLELQVRCRFDAAPDKSCREALIRSCSTIMSLFVQNAWPSSSSVWFKSQVPQILGPILLWRIRPSYETYNLLGADYKPTELQLSVPHSSVIDWIPYSQLRDRVIMYYNYSVVLDRLLCDMMNSYVIEVSDLSQILPQAPRERAFFGIWNIFRAIDLAFENQSDSRRTGCPSGLADFTNDLADEAVKEVENPFGIYSEFALGNQSSSPRCAGERDHQDQSSNLGADRNNKPLNLVDILTTPTSVLKLSHDIRLYASRLWRFDRTLFDKYPELKFNGWENIVAKGRSCRIPTAPPDGPKELTPETMHIYQKALAEV